MPYKILAINPGSTSTKVALYQDESEDFSENIVHSPEELAPFSRISDQFEFRKDVIVRTLVGKGYHLENLSAVVGRGGILPPVKAGGYTVNQAMLDLLSTNPPAEHASNLGAMIAHSIAQPLGIPSYIYDSIASDELLDVAKITGFPEITRHSMYHVLNAKATVRKVAGKLGGDWREMNFIVAHLGGGISLGAHQKGRIVDSIADDAGPFAPERGGSVPLHYLIDLCFEQRLDKRTIMKKIRGDGGLKAYFGTADCREIEKRIEGGDEKAKAVYEAMAYQVAKGIGQLAPILKGEIDAIILTGGGAYSGMLTSMIADYIGFLAPIELAPGENEMESLALGALRILRGEEAPSEFSL